MKKGLLLILVLSLKGALAQAPAPSTPPKPSPSISIALKSLQQRAQQLSQAIQELNADMFAVDGDVRKELPGFHLNPQTIQIEADAASAPTAAGVEKKK